MPEHTLMPESTRSIPTFVFMCTLALGLVTAGCSEQSPKAADAPPPGGAPAASSQPASPQPASPQAGGYEGFLDEVSCQVVRGWAWDPSRPDAPLTIELYDGNRLLKTLAADQLRPDLVDLGKGNGKHMFHEAAPKEFKDGKPHSVRAVIKGTTHELKPSAGTAATVTCEPTGT
jgi:hypothetical protein